MVFLIKGGILSGFFYIPSAALFLTGAIMAMYPRFAVSIFGLASATCFFVPGLFYHRRRQSAARTRIRQENSNSAG
jgi:hypothetical protein